MFGRISPAGSVDIVVLVPGTRAGIGMPAREEDKNLNDYKLISSWVRILEYIVIHRQLGPLPPEMYKKIIEFGKQFEADPTKFVPGGKNLGWYKALGQSMVICIWDVPSLDALTPMIQQLNFMEWESEVIPVEKVSDYIPKAEKAFAEMAGS